MTRVGVALSEHPLATHAVGEVVGGLLETGGPRPDLLVLFATEPHLGMIDDIARAVRHLIEPRVLLGCSATAVTAGPREVTDRGALSAMAMWLGGVALRPVRLTGSDAPVTRGDSSALAHLDELRNTAGTLLLFTDPFSRPLDATVEQLRGVAPDLTVIGGAASVGRRPGGNRLLLDGSIHDSGSVAVHLGPDAPVSIHVSQGTRPVGDPFTVTSAEGRVLRELGGRAALSRLRDVIDGLDEAVRPTVAKGLRIGRVVVDRPGAIQLGDFLVTSVLGADHDAGALLVAEEVAVGATVQFHVRDAGSAHDDLLGTLAGRSAAGVLCCADVARNASFFGCHDHDAMTVSESMETAVVAGAHLSGTVGPVSGLNAVHETSLCMLLVDPTST